MKVVEMHIESKTGDLKDCEDAIVITAFFAAVIDGATSKSSEKVDGISPGQFAANAVREAVEKLDPYVTADEAIDVISSHFSNRVKELSFPVHNRPVASVVIYSEKRSEVWLVGDCKFMLQNKEFDCKSNIEIACANLRSMYLRQLIESGSCSVQSMILNDRGRKYIMPFLRRAYYFRNKNNDDLAFFAIDGDTVPKIGIIKKKIPANAKEIVLSSDGYPRLFRTLEATELYLAKYLCDDPLLIGTHKATKGLRVGQKSYDDRAYCRLSLEKQ